MKNIRPLKENELRKWDDFVAAHPLGTLYHTSSWQKVIKTAFSLKPFYLILEDDKQSIKAGMPLFEINGITGKKLECIPNAQVCDPLVSNQADYDKLMQFILSYLQENHLKCAEIKLSSFFPEKNNGHSTSLDEYSTYLLDITRPLTEIEAGLHKSCIRRRIKKAEKNGIELVVGGSLNDMKIFYKLYVKMRKSIGLLPQPLNFFSALWQHLANDDNLEILHAKYQNEIISSLLLTKYRNTVVYEYGASASDAAQLSPSTFLLWEAIKRSISQGYEKFDFGRTSKDQQSLALFKKRWGTKQENLTYIYLPETNRGSSLSQNNFAKKLMYHTVKMAPERMCQWMGNYLYKYLI